MASVGGIGYMAVRWFDASYYLNATAISAIPRDNFLIRMDLVHFHGVASRLREDQPSIKGNPRRPLVTQVGCVRISSSIPPSSVWDLGYLAEVAWSLVNNFRLRWAAEASSRQANRNTK